MYHDQVTFVHHHFGVFKEETLLDGIGDTENIYNWNVLGKRGNIVQNYPAVEYDFTPRTLQMTQNDLVHIQWAGAMIEYALLSFFFYY